MIYADSSVIVKRYYDEPGSQRVRDRWMGSDRVFTSIVSYAEVHAVLARKRREGGISGVGFRSAALAFENEWRSYDHVLVDTSTLTDVRRLVQRHPLRGFDTIHLAAALWLRRELGSEVEFWVSDERLEAAAGKERLTVVNPERSS
ncbi:MAG TPA: type II toxin-antitoxin system VapC family toxin [Candidatus Methylomirabilis sp.]|nr:type II toxin-antitoxin system VapC family toxin [Candidatus Methylomirabilis sp.]